MGDSDYMNSDYISAAKVILKESVDCFTQDGLEDIEYQLFKDMITCCVAFIERRREREKQ